MTAPTHPHRARRNWRRSWFVPALGVIAVAAAVAIGWRWYAAAPAPAPLEPEWDAVVATLAGDRDDGGAGGFVDPFGVAARADGTVYVADAGERPRIRRIAPGGRIDTIAGGSRGFADGQGAAARFDTPSALALDAAGVLYVADTGNHAVRRIAPDGQVTTVAGDGLPGDTDGPGRQARFNGPIGIAVDAQGRVIVADTYNDRVRAIAVDGTVSTIAGAGGAGVEDGRGPEARFNTPSGVAIGATGEIFVADTGNSAIRRVERDGVVSTLPTDSVRPVGIAVDARGIVYASDERGRVVEFTPDMRGRTLAGSLPGFADGTGPDARFRRLAGLSLAGDGRIIVADAGNGVIRMVVARSRMPVQVPVDPLFRPAFDRDGFARTPLLWPVTPMEGPHEVAGTMGEARGAEGSERFHAGIDVRIDDGTLVRAVRSGTVTSPLSTGDFGSLNEWLRIGPIAYVHVRSGRERGGAIIDHPGFVPGYDERGKLTRVRVRRGTRFEAGDVIASVNPFNHVHLNVGWPGEETNPLDYRLTRFEDSIPPTIAARGIHLYDEAWQPIQQPRRTPPLVSGRIRIVVDGWDQADGNRPNRRLGLYSLGYQVLHPDGTPAPGFERPRQTIVFDRLAVQPDAASLVYAPGSGIPFYRGRRTRFLYIVTNTMRSGAASEGFWDTASLPAGPYVLRIDARDARGNQAMANRDLRVLIGPR